MVRRAYTSRSWACTISRPYTAAGKHPLSTPHLVYGNRCRNDTCRYSSVLWRRDSTMRSSRARLPCIQASQSPDDAHPLRAFWIPGYIAASRVAHSPHRCSVSPTTCRGALGPLRRGFDWRALPSLDAALLRHPRGLLPIPRVPRRMRPPRLPSQHVYDQPIVDRVVDCTKSSNKIFA